MAGFSLSDIPALGVECFGEGTEARGPLGLTQLSWNHHFISQAMMIEVPVFLVCCTQGSLSGRWIKEERSNLSTTLTVTFHVVGKIVIFSEYLTWL